MTLYDELVKRMLSLLEGIEGRRLDIAGAAEGERQTRWPDAGDSNLILRGEMAYELGGGELQAVSGLAFTSSKKLVDDDELWLYGPDLGEIKSDTPYARLTFLRVGDNAFSDENDAYASIRNVEHTRYKINPKGYMMRISAANEREPVRIGRAALNGGLSFENAGRLFLDGYRRNPKVLAAKMIFITAKDFPYGELAHCVSLSEKITGSLDHILKNLKMDCAVCNLKEVCDEVEGFKQLHFAQTKK